MILAVLPYHPSKTEISGVDSGLILTACWLFPFLPQPKLPSKTLGFSSGY